MAAVDCEMAPRDDLLFKGVANKLTCLASNSNTLSKECFLGEVDSTLDFIVEQQGSKCKDELRSKCGKQIDALKKAIEHTSVIGTVKGVVDVVECIVNHAEDLWNHCKPGQKAENEAVLADEENSPSCEARAVELCPATQHKVLGLGFTLGCLVEKAPVLGNGCAHERIAAALDELENSADRPCHDELRKKCGKQIDKLKKEVQETSVLGTLKAAVDVVQCVAQNAEDLWNKCRPFEAAVQQLALGEEEPVEELLMEEKEESGEELAFVAGAPTPPTRKPTHKPTRRPTKRPTNKPTLRPTAKPTKSVSPTTVKPTARPTPRKIADFLINNAMEDENVVGTAEGEDENVVELVQLERPYPDDRRRPHPHHDDDRRPHPHHDDDDRRRPCPHHHDHDDEHHRRHHHHHHRHHGHGGPMMMDTRGGMHFSHKSEDEVAMMGEDGELVQAGFEFDMEECVRSARKFCAAEVADFNASPFDRNLLEAMNACIDRNAAIIEADCMVSAVEVYRFDPPHGHGFHRCRKFWKHLAAGVVALLFTLVLARKCYVRRMKAKLANQGEVIQAEPQYQPLVDAKGPTMV